MRNQWSTDLRLLWNCSTQQIAYFLDFLIDNSTTMYHISETLSIVDACGTCNRSKILPSVQLIPMFNNRIGRYNDVKQIITNHALSVHAMHLIAVTSKCHLSVTILWHLVLHYSNSCTVLEFSAPEHHDHPLIPFPISPPCVSRQTHFAVKRIRQRQRQALLHRAMAIRQH